MPSTVAIALGSNLGDRALTLRRAVRELQSVMTVVRVSTFIETKPVDAPPGSPDFLNAVAIGFTMRSPEALLDVLQEIEKRLGRRRTGVRNAPRTIDLDLLFHSAHRIRTRRLMLPHPRYRQRDFVIRPLREVWRSG